MGGRQRTQQEHVSHNTRKKISSSQKGFGNKSTPDQRRFIRGWQDFSNTSSSSPQNGLSMSQEARNTERHASGWSQTKLRDTGITFVSAGNLLREEPANTEDEANNFLENTTNYQPPTSCTNTCQESEPELNISNRANIGEDKTSENNKDDLNNGIKPTTETEKENSQQLLVRKASTSSSGSEEIVFSGRQQKSQTLPIRSNGNAFNQRSLSPKKGISKPISPSKIHSSIDPTVTEKPPGLADFHSISTGRTQGPSRSFPKRIARSQVKTFDEVEALMEDYIANMAVDDSEEDQDEHSGSRTEHFRNYHGTGEKNVKVQTKVLKPTQEKSQISTRHPGWTSDDLKDFDELSTTDEDIPDISQVLRHRHRSTGLQYLVIANGKDDSDAKWVLHNTMTSKAALDHIRSFEEDLGLQVEQNEVSTDSSTGADQEDADDDLINDIESEEEENIRILRDTSRMTDEQIAQALAKQEEFGMGGDELLLFGGDFGQDDDLYEDESPQMDNFVPFSMKTHTSNRTRSKHNKRARDSFPPAAAFADALEQDPYEGFDIMDFDRPSLRPRKGGRKSNFPYELELEDESMEEQLYETWMKDRQKKASRKREKAEARMAELLDSTMRSEPSVIKAEIRKFLVHDTATLKLAPMDSRTRESVHRLAKALKLKSRSEGKENQGIGRYPVLSKTASTPTYTIETIGQIDALMDLRKFFPKHLDYRGSRALHAAGTGNKDRRGGGGVLSGATHREGDIVGASAPEIGSENKGRAMLEKMGWKTGMAIGKEGNKGRLESIQHVVKTTKAGLG